jgi:mono/diheme cytochrome c family protein
VGAVVILLAIFPPVAVAWKRAAKIGVPRVQILQDMDAQPKFRAQSASALFLDGRSSRPWVANTIARNRLATDSHRFEGLVDGQPARTFPASIPLTLETMRRGQERYAVFCAVCHGLAGDGDGMVAKRAQTRIEPAWAPPAQLYAAPVRSQPVGQLYRSITNGVRTMPAYRFQIDVADRWAIVLYLQALQRSQAAREEDVPEDVRQRLK